MKLDTVIIAVQNVGQNGYGLMNLRGIYFGNMATVIFTRRIVDLKTNQYGQNNHKKAGQDRLRN